MPIHAAAALRPAFIQRIWSRHFTLVAVTAVLIGSHLPSNVEASREEQGSADQPFEGVKEDIQQKLTKAAQNLEKSSFAQAEVTKKVAGHIGQYHTHVKNIASTMGQVLQAKSSLTKAYHEDMKSGEETRVGPLEVNFVEVLGEDYGPPQGDFTSGQSTSRDRQVPSHRDAEPRSPPGGSPHEDDEVVDTNAQSQSNANTQDEDPGPPGDTFGLSAGDTDGHASSKRNLANGGDSDLDDEPHPHETENTSPHEVDAHTDHVTDDERRDLIEASKRFHQTADHDRQDQTPDDDNEPLTHHDSNVDGQQHTQRDTESNDVQQDGGGNVDTDAMESPEDAQKKQMNADFGNPEDDHWDDDNSNNFDHSGASSLSQLEEAPAPSEPEEMTAEEALPSSLSGSSLSQLDSEADAQEEEDMEQVQKLQERLLSQKRKLEHRHSLHRHQRNSQKVAHKAASHGRGRGRDRSRPARHSANSAVRASSYETTGMKGNAKNLEMRRKLYRDHAQRIAEAGMKWKVPSIRHPRQRRDSIAVNPRSLVRNRRHQRDDDHDGDDEDDE